jgi:hypothetical protein
MRPGIGSFTILLALLGFFGDAGAGVMRIRITPDSTDAPPFGIVLQYTAHDGQLSFDVCADSSAMRGEMSALLRLADTTSQIAATQLHAWPCDLGLRWHFSLRDDLLSGSTFEVLARRAGSSLPGGTIWIFELGPLAERLFHIEPEPACPPAQCTLPRDKYEVPDFHVLRYSGGEVLDVVGGQEAN